MSTNTDSTDLQPCTCFGATTISAPGEYEVCERCVWEDDPVQSADPDYAGGANVMSLNQARHEWSSKGDRQHP